MKHDLTPEKFFYVGGRIATNLWVHGKNPNAVDNRVESDDIDIIRDYPDNDMIQLSGLHQDMFEYFIKTYGKQFKYIHFFKNNKVQDWSLLGELPQLEYIYWYWNQRIENFWDMSKNISLKGVNIADFSRLKSIDGIETAPNLKAFAVGNQIWSKSDIESFKPLANCEKIEHIYFYGKRILDTDFSFVKDLKELKDLSLKCNLLSTEQYAWIVGNCPQLKGASIEPAWTFDHSSYTWVSVFGKGKRGFKLEGNEEKLKKIEAEFWALADSLKDKPYPKSGH